MTHKHFFQWNIPADNQFTGKTDRYIDVIATWDDKQYYNDGRPMVFTHPSYDFCFSNAMQVKDWSVAIIQIDAVATKHFAEIAKTTRLNKAREILIKEGESNIPTLDRYEADLLTQEILT